MSKVVEEYSASRIFHPRSETYTGCGVLSFRACIVGRVPLDCRGRCPVARVTTARLSSVAAVAAMWLLLQSGENWSWVIIGGFESQEECQQARETHILAPELLLCAPTGSEPSFPRTEAAVAHGVPERLEPRRATSDGSD
jgi:hypothetical protein